MKINSELIINLLEKLVSPQYEGIINYNVELDIYPSQETLWVGVEVIFDKKKFLKQEELNDELEVDVILSVKSTLRYLNIYKSIIDVYLSE